LTFAAIPNSVLLDKFLQTRRYTFAMKKMAFVLLLGLAGVRSAVSQGRVPEIDGYVTRVASSSDFDVNGLRVLCGKDTQTKMGLPKSKEFLSNQGCPQDTPLLGQPMQIYGSLKKKEHAVEATLIEAQPVISGEISGSAVIDAMSALDSSEPQSASLMVRADGYRIHIDSKTEISWSAPLNSIAAVTAGNWIEYKGRQRADGVVEAESAKLGPNTVSDGEEKLRARYEFDPASVSPSEKQSTASMWFIGVRRKRFPPYTDAAMQARVDAIGAKLIPAYQRALPDSDPAKINFRFQVIDTSWFRDALSLPSGIILVPHQVIERMQNDSQLASVLADNMACALEKQQYRNAPALEALTAATWGADVAGIFIPGLGFAGTGTSIAAQELATKTEDQSGRVSLGLLHDAGYDLDQAPIAWWLLASKKPILRTPMPHRAAYLYRALGENWQAPVDDPPKP
jgi:hypothetical protein